MTYQQRTDETARAARMRAYDRDAATLRDPQYCAQHDRSRGHSALLRPRPWEYSYHGRNPQGE